MENERVSALGRIKEFGMTNQMLSPIFRGSNHYLESTLVI